MPLKRPKYTKSTNKNPRQHYIDNGAWDEILERISHGEPVRIVLGGTGVRQNKNYPSWSTWWRMVSDSEELRNQYLEAKRKSAEADAQKMEIIVDNLMHSNTLDERRAKVALDGLKFIMAFKEPRKYGNKMGEEEGAVNVIDVLNKLADKMPGG